MRKSLVYQDIKEIINGLKKELSLLQGTTLLISGGAGFIGQYIIAVIEYANRKYFKKDCQVISIDNYITGYKSRLQKEHNNFFVFINHDIRKPIEVKNKVDYIIHAAGLASPIYYQKYPLETLETAVFGAKNLLELARVKKVKSFLFFSSSEIYGDPDPKSIPTPESYRGNVATIGSRACYDESKRLGETLCMIYYEKFKIPVKIVRPFNVFGPGMKVNDYRVIPTFLVNSIKGKYLPVHDNGNQTRTFCYITDAVTAFFKVLLSNKNAEVYNVGNDANEINMMSLAKIISELFKNKPEVKTIAYPHAYPKDEPKRRCPDLTKIKTSLGYQPKVSLKTGLNRTLKWYQEVLNV